MPAIFDDEKPGGPFDRRILGKKTGSFALDSAGNNQQDLSATVLPSTWEGA